MNKIESKTAEFPETAQLFSTDHKKLYKFLTNQNVFGDLECLSDLAIASSLPY